MRLIVLASRAAILSAGAARAQTDEYHITTAEKAICTDDAVRLCSDAYPDEIKLLVCLRANRTSLTSNCAAVFKEGLKV